MATESLNVPEEHLAEVVEIIRAGLIVVESADEVAGPLRDWCEDVEEYLARLASDES